MTTASTVSEKDAFGIDEANVTISHNVSSESFALTCSWNTMHCY